MATRKIIKEGDPNLRKVCRPVEKFDQRLWDLLDDLKDTLHEVSGLGLASPQVNVLRRVAIVEYDDVLLELVNPVLLESEGECLDNKIEYFDRFGEKRRFEAEDYFARAILHEMDHLDGILFTDKMVKRIELKRGR